MTHPRPQSGSVMLEFALAAPLLFALVFFCLQIAHVWLARQVVQYAAFAAARTLVTAHPSEYERAARRAAEQVCAWVVIGQAPAEPEREIPGWGPIPGSGAVARKTRVRTAAPDEWNVQATVELDFALLYPIAGPMIAWGVNPSGDWTEKHVDKTGDAHRRTDSVPYPHLVLRETAILSKPFKTLHPTGVAPGGR